MIILWSAYSWLLSWFNDNHQNRRKMCLWSLICMSLIWSWSCVVLLTGLVQTLLQQCDCNMGIRVLLFGPCGTWLLSHIGTFEEARRCPGWWGSLKGIHCWEMELSSACSYVVCCSMLMRIVAVGWTRMKRSVPRTPSVDNPWVVSSFWPHIVTSRSQWIGQSSCLIPSFHRRLETWAEIPTKYQQEIRTSSP